MATTFEFTIACEMKDAGRAQRLLDEAQALVGRLESELSEFLPESPVYRLNHAEVGERIRAPESLLRLLELSKKLGEETQGRFDCSAKSQKRFAGEFPFAWDRSDERNAARPRKGTVWRLHKDAHLGFGAIGKGFALDEASLILHQNGFEDFCLSAGGSTVLLSGFRASASPWSWAWSWKKDAQNGALGKKFDHPTGKRIAIGVSGTHEQGRHIIDPRTGERPALAQSALLGRNSGAEADALSTAFFISPKDFKTDAAQPAAWIDAQGTARWNGSFQKLWGPVSAMAFAAANAVIFAATTSLVSSLIFSSAARADDAADGAVDLGSMGANAFTPYVFERSKIWLALPLFTLGMIVLHMMRRRKRAKIKAEPLS